MIQGPEADVFWNTPTPDCFAPPGLRRCIAIAALYVVRSASDFRLLLEDMDGEAIALPGREPVRVYDLETADDAFKEDVLDGLGQTTKALPSKYFYDERGLRLFKQITELPAYYLTRSEISILEKHGEEIGRRFGHGCLIIEFGGGDSTKVELLLGHLDAPAAYVPVDISREHLLEAARGVAARYPDLPVIALCTDYMALKRVPEIPQERTVVYFPGSTVGNLRPREATSFMVDIAQMVGRDGCLLIGVDLKKDRDELEQAYNDPQGITAAFNKNVLVRINRELGGAFDLEAFAHRATYNQALGRIEMHLVSTTRQDVEVAGRTITFQEGETIHTENSYKYAIDEFAELAGEAGFAVEHVWTDPGERFSLQLLTVRA